MRFRFLCASILVSLLVFVFDSNAYETADSGSYCNLDPPQSNGLQNLTCVNETDFFIIGGGGGPIFWWPMYMAIPGNYSGAVVDLWVYVGIRHSCAGDLFVDLTSPNNTRIRLSKRNVTFGGGATCPTEQFPQIPLISGAPYTPIWIDNGTVMPSPGENNDFPGAMDSFRRDKVSGKWFLNVSDQGSLDTGNVSFWAITMTINRSVDFVPPLYFDNISSSVNVYNPSALSNFSIKWNDTNNSISVMYIENNFTGVLLNDSLSGNQLSFNNFIYYYNLTLPAGIFQYKYYAEDDAGNWNITDVYYTNVNRSNNTYTVHFNTKTPSNPVTYIYGSTSNVTVFKNTQEGNLSVYLNESFIATNTTSVVHIAILPAGTSIYRFVHNQTQNYTHNETTLQFDITKNSSFISITYTPSSIHTYGQITGAYCNITTGDASATMSLWSNFTLVSTGQGNRTVAGTTFAGIYNGTCRYYESQNFSELTSYNNILIIQRALPILNLTFDMVESNKTIARCYSANVTAWADTDQGQINLYKKNSTHTINPVNGSRNATYLMPQCEVSGSELNFTAFYPETQNYSSASKTYSAFIDSAPPLFYYNRSDIQSSVSEDNFSANFTILWEDNVNISIALFEHNFSGAFANATMNGFGFFYYNSSVKTGYYTYRFLANDTTDFWNATDYFTFSVSYNPAPPPLNPSGGGGGGGGGTTTTITTTTTTTLTTTSTTTTIPIVQIKSRQNENMQEGQQIDQNVNGEERRSGQTDETGMITGLAFAAKNPLAAVASLLVLGIIALNYLGGYDRFLKRLKPVKKVLRKLIKSVK